jgi:7-cyano-7-deazaguanine synthase in queuosine biosynthesis
MAKPTVSGIPRYQLVFNADGHALLESDGERLERDNSYIVNDQRIGYAIGRDLPADLADLVDFAMAVYMADRSCPRRRPNADRYELQWTRRFEICLPLRCPERWRNDDVQHLLNALLWFLTEDQWSFRFVPRPEHDEPCQRQGFLFPTPLDTPVTVALFSGGLDSFAGLAEALATRRNGTVVTVAGTTNQRLTGIQRRLLSGLRNQLGARVVSVEIPFGLRRGGQPYDQEERTQRSRGLVFALFGAVSAVMARVDRLDVFENGIGAINLPFSDGQLGAQGTRATHPLALRDISKLVTFVTDHNFEIASPLLFISKGQLCHRIANLGLDDFVRATVSCDGFPFRARGPDHCGTCTSCLLRRISLRAANFAMADSADRYRRDALDPRVRLSPAQANPTYVMSDQVARMVREMSAPVPWKGLSREFPQLAEVAEVVALKGWPISAVQDQLVGLYRTYCEEWRRFECQLAAQPISRLS